MKYFKLNKNVDDIHNIGNSFVSSNETSSDLTIDELYIKLAENKKKVQVLLNIYYHPVEFEQCEIANYGKNPQFDLLNSKRGSKEFLIKMIGEYLVCYQMLCRKHLEGSLDNKSDFLIGSICCYCDIRFETNKKSCNMCGADNNDLKDYAFNHYETLLKQRKTNKKNSTFYQKIEEINEIESLYSRSNSSYILKEKENISSNKFISDNNNFDNQNNIKINKNNNFNDDKFDNKLSENWNCNKCSFTNTEDFCAMCFNNRISIIEWKCEKCNNLNEFLGENCSKCKLSNKNIKKCNKCKLTTISLDRDYCDSCFCQLDQQSYSNNNKNNIQTLIEKENTTSSNEFIKDTTTTTITTTNINNNNHNNNNNNYNNNNNNINNFDNQNNIKINKNNNFNDVKVGKLTENWNCNKCGFTNTEDFCAICFNNRISINKWKCEKCNNLNEFLRENCSKCKLSNKNIKKCNKCKLNRIPVDRDYCDLCFCQINQLKCWNKKCGKLNDENYLFCAYCKFEKNKKDIFCINKKSEKFWQCQICYQTFKYSPNTLFSTNQTCQNCKKHSFIFPSWYQITKL